MLTAKQKEKDAMEEVVKEKIHELNISHEQIDKKVFPLFMSSSD